MPSHKKLRPRRAVVSPDSENATLDGAPLSIHRCSHADHPPLHNANGHNRHRTFSSDEKISNLTQLNVTLVKQVSTIRSETSAKIKSLEELLQSSRSNADALLTELRDERSKFELELASLKASVAGLEVEKTALQAEKDELEDALSDLSVRQQQLKEQLEVERKASASSKIELHGLTNDVEILRIDNEKLADLNKKLTDENEEVIEMCSGLKSENVEIRSKLKVLSSKEATLEEKLSELRRVYDEEHLKAIDARKTIEALQAEASRKDEATARLDGQLIEASRRIAFLETQHVAAIERQCLLDSQVKGLGNDLLMERDAHAKAESALEQERRAKEVGILAVACEIEKLRVDKEKLVDESNGYKSTIADMQINVKHRQAKEVKLEEELVRERKSHAAAQMEITNANESMKRLRDAEATRTEVISKLERELSDASQRIVSLETQGAAAADKQIDLQLQVARLESELIASRTELQNASSALEQEREAKEDEICALTCKVEHLRLDKEKLNEKNTALSAKNTGFQSAMKLLQSKEATVGKELAKLRGSYSSAQMKINEMNRSIKALESEAARRVADAAKFEEQLKESSQHIACLESKGVASTEMQMNLESQIRSLQNDLREQEMQAKETLDSKMKVAAKLEEHQNEASQQIADLESQIAASVERQIELETRIRTLENDLLASNNAHLSVSSALDKEVQARSSFESLLVASQTKSRSLEEHLESVKSCVLGQHYNSNADAQSFQSLQSQLACLVNDKKSLEETKTALEKKVSLLNARSIQASLKAKAESDKLAEQLRQLELALNDAKDEASLRDSKLSRLESDLRSAKRFLEEKSRLVRLALPVAVVSTSALIFFGLLSYVGLDN